MIKVLNHGHVGLVSHMGDDLAIVRNARVSTDAAWRTGTDKGSDARLINYLYENRHTSPFESVTFTFDVKAPIFVFRQWHRHRTWSYNEVSARYSELPEEYYVPLPEHIGTQSETNHQSRVLDAVSFNMSASEIIQAACITAFNTYNELLNLGVPRELARGVLPVNTYSHMFATVDLHNLFGFLRLRLDEHAQYEIRVYAEAMLELIKPIVPEAVKAFEKTRS